MRGRRRQQGQRANRPRLAPKAEEERQWKEEAISAAQAQPWRPSWERKPLTNLPVPPAQRECSGPQLDESLVTSSKPWRPSWEKGQPEPQLKDLAPRLMPAWQPCAVANLRRRIWASKRFAESGAKKLEELHLVKKCDDKGDKDDIDAFSQSDAKTVATTSLHSEAGNESVSRDADVHSEQSYSELLTDATAAEESLQHILARLQDESAQLSPLREWLFNTVRDAAKEALGENFERMTLVGSVALQIDIPASDVDAVTFTTRAVEGIQALHATAAALREQEPTLNVQVIATARVPILMVSTADHAVRMDMSVNQKLPDEHARWVGDLKVFKEEQQIARDFLRSVKYWHSQRQIPGTKEGGYPALAWLFLALHVLTVHARGTSSTSQRPLKLLKEFFSLIDTDSMDGGAMTSDPTSWCAPPTWRTQGFWPFPSIQDPVTNMTNMTNSGGPHGPHGAHFLTHEIPAATQLLYAAEFRRARVLIAAAERTGSSIAPLFEPRDRATSLPVAYDGNIVLILKGGKIWAVEPLAVRQLRGGWKAPFLHRCDCQSQVRARVHGVDGRTGLLTPFPELRATMDFTPSEFVATVAQCRGEPAGVRRLVPGDLQLWQDMCQLLQKGEPPTSQL